MKIEPDDVDVVSLRADASLRDAARAMREHGVGSVLVVDEDDRLVGIATDRDLCLRAVAWDRDPDETPLREAMTHDVRSVRVDAALDEIAAPMRKLGVRRVPLVDGDGRPVGLVALDDWLQELSERLSDLAATTAPGRSHGSYRPPARLAALMGEVVDELARKRWLVREDLLEHVDELRDRIAGPRKG